MKHCGKQKAGEDKAAQEAAKKAQDNLALLEEKDPKTVKAAKRFLLP